VERERYLEQRIARQLAFRREFFHQFLEWQVLVRVRRQRAFAHPPQVRGRKGRPVGRPQHQGIDEKSDQALELRPPASAIGVPTAIFLPRVAIQQDLVSGKGVMNRGGVSLRVSALRRACGYRRSQPHAPAA
jgi:hypothetical protein